MQLFLFAIFVEGYLFLVQQNTKVCKDQFEFLIFSDTGATFPFDCALWLFLNLTMLS